jgi:DNA polymerase-1
MVNFGLIYGITSFGLSQRLGISRSEAKQIMDTYFEQYKGIKAFMDQSTQAAREKGYATTLMGRKHYLNDIHSNNPTIRGFAERNAINTPIQGTAADMIKLAMIHTHKQLNDHHLQTKMMLQVHDELLFDVPKSEQAIVEPIIRKAMTEALPLNVPIEVNIGFGTNWLDAH